MNRPRSFPRYVLITPARNEAAFIEKTIESVIHQTVLPAKWVIVDDGSTDETARSSAAILRSYPWIELVNLPVRRDRSFAAKVHAFNAGYERVRGLGYEIIGNLDADISFDKDHFEFLLRQDSGKTDPWRCGNSFQRGRLQLGSGQLRGAEHVSGQCQIFRRQCCEEIGGYIANRAGGIDWMAVTTARMMGWKTEVIPREVVLSLPALGNRGTQCCLPAVFLRREGLLSRRASGLGTFPSGLPNAPSGHISSEGLRWAGLLLGLSATRTPRPVSGNSWPSTAKNRWPSSRPSCKGCLSDSSGLTISTSWSVVIAASLVGDYELTTLIKKIEAAVDRFADWLDRYGETSYDHQSFFASKLGRGAKALYYRQPLLGTLAVAPMMFCEAFRALGAKTILEAAAISHRRRPLRHGLCVPCAASTRRDKYYRASRSLPEVLQETRCQDYEDYCWGYPFDWETRTGTMKEGTPTDHDACPMSTRRSRRFMRSTSDAKWLRIMRSIAEHAFQSYRDMETGAGCRQLRLYPRAGRPLRRDQRERLSGISSDQGRHRALGTAVPGGREKKSELRPRVSKCRWLLVLFDRWRERFCRSLSYLLCLKALAKIEQLTGCPGAGAPSSGASAIT